LCDVQFRTHVKTVKCSPLREGKGEKRCAGTFRIREFKFGKCTNFVSSVVIQRLIDCACSTEESTRDARRIFITNLVYFYIYMSHITERVWICLCLGWFSVRMFGLVLFVRRSEAKQPLIGCLFEQSAQWGSSVSQSVAMFQLQTTERIWIKFGT
jgi:hypothetical protein